MNDEWARIDQWMREDSAWLFEAARPVPHRGSGPSPAQAIRQLERLTRQTQTLEQIAPPPGLDARLRLALLRCPRLTGTQELLSRRLIARHRTTGQP
jgi:hypothetical protein